MQSASSRIWTRIVVYISYDDNHYTMGTAVCMSVCLFLSLSLSLYIYIYIYSFHVVRDALNQTVPLKNVKR